MLSLFYQKFLSSTVILTVPMSTPTGYGRVELDTVRCKNQKNYCNTKDCVSVQDFYFSFCSVQFNIYVLNIYIFYILFKGAFPFSFFASTFNFNNDARIPVRK